MFDSENLFKNRLRMRLAGLMLVMCSFAHGQVYLVKEFAHGPQHSAGDGVPDEVVEAGGITYFVAETNLNGIELWKTDGTRAGTVIVKDISPGPESSFPAQLTDVNGTLFFSAYNREHGEELWKSDGTPEGTVIVKDLADGNNNSGSPRNLFSANGILYFTAYGPFFQSLGLMKSDGTEAGTVVVSTEVHNPRDWVNAGNGWVYFSGSIAGFDQELWKTDGTPSGTRLIKDINAGTEGSSPAFLVNINTIVYFSAYNGSNQELWRTDGSLAGTYMVADLNGTLSSFPNNLVSLNNKLYFMARTSAEGNEIWTSDGTQAGTHIVADINPDGDGALSNAGQDNPFVVLGNNLYFFGRDNNGDYQIWKSDGTSGGTGLAADVLQDGYPGFPAQMTAYNGSLYFATNGGGPGGDMELWRSDGTQAGTHLFKNIHATDGSFPSGFSDVNGRLYFRAADGEYGRELWSSDGTADGTTMVSDIGAGTQGSYIGQRLTIGNVQYLEVYDEAYGSELWKTDGTTEGTEIVKDIYPGPTSSNPDNYININGTLFFTIYNPDANVYQIWKSDGTEAGTIPVSAEVESIRNLIHINGIIYFTANESASGRELWMCEVETGATGLVKDIYAGLGSSEINNMTDVDGTLFFTANPGDSRGYELWKSDGTADGTVMVKNINTSTSGASDPHELTVVNNMLFFAATDADGDEELWRSDGSEAGTIKLDINPDGSSWLRAFTVLNGMLYFQAYYEVEGHGTELWKSDGTESGTVLAATIASTNAAIDEIILVNDILYFQLNDGTHGNELWKTDGTETGTALVKDIWQGPIGTEFDDLWAVGNKLYFTTGNTLWKSEGDACNTVPVTDSNQIVVYDLLSEPIGDKLLFIGSNATSGSELFAYDLSHAVTGACEQTITFGAPDPKTYGDAPFEVSATSSSGLEVTLESSNPAVATVNGKTITITGAGETVITAKQAGDKDFKPAQDVTRTLTVNKKAQSITFAALPSKKVGDAAFDPGATASSNLTVSYTSSNPGVAAVDGDKITIVGAGETVITASQAGDNSFAAAAEVTQTLTVTKNAQSITFAALPVKRLGDAAFDPGATATSGLVVTYTSSNPSVAVVDGNMITIVGAGISTIKASQGGDETHDAAPDVEQALIVNKKTQTITFNALADVFLGDAPFNLTATASSALTVSYTSSNTAVATISGNVVTITGEGETIITASQDGDDAYAAAEAATQKLVVKLITEAEANPDRIASVYPNPVTDRVVVETQVAAEGSTVEVTDLYGRPMNVQAVEANAFIHTLDVSHLPAGVYLLQVTKGTQVITTKRIVKK